MHEIEIKKLGRKDQKKINFLPTKFLANQVSTNEYVQQLLSERLKDPIFAKNLNSFNSIG